VGTERDVIEVVVDSLRSAGARFALVFGSRARETAHATSDLDVAAWWPSNPPNPWDLTMPAGVDLVVWDRIPLELAGRIALEGTILFDDDPAARVRWVADTRKIWLDEWWRFEAAHREYLESVTRGR
jgi:predicted nucleotidyltransferase